MKKGNQQLLIIAGVGVLAYLWWKNRNGANNGNGITGGTKPAIVNPEAKSSFKGGPIATTKSCNIIVTDCPGHIGRPVTLIPSPDGRGCICPRRF